MLVRGVDRRTDGRMDRYELKERRGNRGASDIPKDMASFVELDGPFGLAAVAFALVGRHDCCLWSALT